MDWKLVAKIVILVLVVIAMVFLTSVIIDWLSEFSVTDFVMGSAKERGYIP